MTMNITVGPRVPPAKNKFVDRDSCICFKNETLISDGIEVQAFSVAFSYIIIV